MSGVGAIQNAWIKYAGDKKEILKMSRLKRMMVLAGIITVLSAAVCGCRKNADSVSGEVYGGGTVPEMVYGENDSE